MLMYVLIIFGRLDKKQLTWSPFSNLEMEWQGDREAEWLESWMSVFTVDSASSCDGRKRNRLLVLDFCLLGVSKLLTQFQYW